ncbi:hypothetical protein K488DRAFT_86162 [Vararia minispora EC-137]|uniref:Uncharacterized protein n=1 Tax=Vararia minispora EC-137 TaxID=1314806 RepID=A0ACB8QJV3_9AGAM|nr:hypothetical protein K488DRAFT_86162 [Vararia minispora EC-137]
MHLPLFFDRRADPHSSVVPPLNGVDAPYIAPQQGSGQQSPVLAGDGLAEHPFVLLPDGSSDFSSSSPMPVPSMIIPLSGSNAVTSTPISVSSDLASHSPPPTTPVSAPSAQTTTATIPSPSSILSILPGSSSTSPSASSSSSSVATASYTSSLAETSLIPSSTPPISTVTLTPNSSVPTLSSAAPAIPSPAIAASDAPDHPAPFYIGIAFAIVAVVALLLSLSAWWYRIRARTRRRPWEIGSRASSRVNLWWDPSRDRDAGEPKRSTSTLINVVKEKQESSATVDPPPARPPLPAALIPSETALPTLATTIANGPRSCERACQDSPPIEDIGTPREAQNAIVPRYLSLDGAGLGVPWAEPRARPRSPHDTPPLRPDADDRWRARLSGRPLPAPPPVTGESWTDSLCRRANLVQGFNLFNGVARAPVNSTDFAALRSTDDLSVPAKDRRVLAVRVPEARDLPRPIYAARTVSSPAREPDLTSATFVPPPVPPLPPQYQGVLRNPHSLDDHGHDGTLLRLSLSAHTLSLITYPSDAGLLSRSSSVAVSRASSVALSRGPTMVRATKKFRLDEYEQAARHALQARGREVARAR